MPELHDQETNVQYSELIKSLVPISELAPQLQNELISRASILSFKKKEFVFKQGDMDDYAFYLLDGQIELLSNNNVQSTIISGTDSARYAMARLQPRQFSARAKTDIVILELERTALDRLLVVDQQNKAQGPGDGGVDVEVSHIAEEESGDWMTRILQSELFSRLPTANIQKMFVLLEAVAYKAGDTVIRQGDVGDYYYIIQEGRCEVVRAPTQGAKLIRLAELHPGDSFGEEALLTNATRNASIRMLADGVLMRLSKNDFINLIKKPTLNEVPYAEAKKLVDVGQAEWLDVRYQNEYDESKLEGSLHIPLTILRLQTAKLDKDKRYIVYCDTGGRSSAATFLLTNLGFNVGYLTGGLAAVPQDALEKKPPQPVAAEPRSVSPAPVPHPAPVQKEIRTADLEPDIRASVLEASLAKTSMVLEEAMKKQPADPTAAMKEMQRRLEAEKKKLEAEKLAAEKEARKRREQEEEKIRKLQEATAKRMEAEKKKLEEVYIRNTRDMEKLQRLKEEAEAQIRKEREKLERETAESQRKLNEARQVLEEQAARKRAEQEAQERALQARTKASLEENRRKIAEEIARRSEELDGAKQARVLADAARQAAQEEARKIIAEYKQKIDQERAREQAKLQEEREKFEQESLRIQASLQEILETRKEAEAIRAAAQAEMRALQMQQKLGGMQQDAELQQKISTQIKVAEAKMQQAQKKMEDAEQAQIRTTAAVQLNAQELQKRKEEEERIRKQVEADLMLFEADQKKEAPSVDEALTYTEHAKRIKQRSDEAKMKMDEATRNLFDDVSSQLTPKDDD